MASLLMLMAGVVLALLLIAAVGVVYLTTTGLTARPEPGRIEAALAGTALRLAIPGEVRARQNPVPRSPDVIAEGMAHFADHCAVCHANDGSGNTDMGRNLYPKAPDMRVATTQDLTDGELFWIIENGIRFTGMPGWSSGTKEGEETSWHLVHFIRHLPTISEPELERMEALNPKPPAEIRQQIEEERFLRGDEPAPTEPEGGHRRH